MDVGIPGARRLEEIWKLAVDAKRTIASIQAVKDKLRAVSNMSDHLPDSKLALVNNALDEARALTICSMDECVVRMPLRFDLLASALASQRITAAQCLCSSVLQ